MRHMRWIFVVSALVLGLTKVGEGRVIHIWSEAELLTKSDLVVVATPIATHDTTERVSPFMGYDRMGEALGVETTFMISAVLKGHLEKKTLVLHHYRGNVEGLPNGPKFVAFDPLKKRSFRLYLSRESGGRYVPVSGQQDPVFSVFDASKKPAPPVPPETGLEPIPKAK